MVLGVTSTCQNVQSTMKRELTNQLVHVVDYVCFIILDPHFMDSYMGCVVTSIKGWSPT